MASYNYDWLHTAQAQYNPPVYTTPAPGSDYSTLIGAVGDPQPHEMVSAMFATFPNAMPLTPPTDYSECAYISIGPRHASSPTN